MASSDVAEVQGDPYRSHMYGEGEKNTVWRTGAPPDYSLVNKLFEEGRTNVWAEGSKEENVQRLLKTWEMEIGNKLRAQDYKTISAERFTHSVNGVNEKNIQEILEIGGYNQFLQTSLPPNLRAYDPSKYSSVTSQTLFMTTFPRGFAVEIIEVYSGAPKIAFKFRHWSYMEGPFQQHAPTGELVQFYGISIFTVDKAGLIEKAEFFFDPNELISQLIKGPLLDGAEPTASLPSGCPLFNKS